MPTEIRPRTLEATHASASVWLQLILLLFYVASFVTMAEGLAAANEALLFAAP